MREIIFRGKRVDNGEWVEGNLFIPDKKDTPTQICIGTNIIRITYDVIPESISEFTGLTDKNGKKIFEGDVVGRVWDNGDSFVYKVIFDSNMCCFIAERHSGFSTLDSEFKIIGNIHDNPELLKGGAE